MEDQVKNIVSLYTKIPVNQLFAETMIARSSVGGSIVLHRMYGALANAGFMVENYQDIQYFGALLDQLNGKGRWFNGENSDLQDERMAFSGDEDLHSLKIGIDVEEIGQMPSVNDFREDEFYKMNFSL